MRAHAAGLAGVVACVLGLGCGGQSAGWQTVYDDHGLGGALLSAWGTSRRDVYLVGGPLGNSGFDAVAVHYDGSVWRRLTPGGADSFWWVTGSGSNDVWMVGEHGRVTHWDGTAFAELPRFTTATLWGAWTAAVNDLWVVGGTPEGGTQAPNDIIAHWDGNNWRQETLSNGMLGRSIYKIWGASADDLYAVGEAATVWHRRGTTWSFEANPARSTLLTVYGCNAHDVYAVGGSDVIRSDGQQWSAVDVKLSSVVNGVTCDGAGQVLVVGLGGFKQRLVGGRWIDDGDVQPYGDFHGAWSDGEGSFWAVGGNFLSMASAGTPRRALIGHYGARQSMLVP